jgi:hypothetical protein
MSVRPVSAKDSVSGPQRASHPDGGSLLADGQMTWTLDLTSRDHRSDRFFHSPYEDHATEAIDQLVQVFPTHV